MLKNVRSLLMRVVSDVVLLLLLLLELLLLWLLLLLVVLLVVVADVPPKVSNPSTEANLGGGGVGGGSVGGVGVFHCREVVPGSAWTLTLAPSEMGRRWVLLLLL